MDTMLSKTLREFLTGSLNQLIVNLGGEDGEVWERQLKKFLRKEACWTNNNPHLRQIAAGTIPATDGRRTFVQANRMFPGYFDLDFEKFGTNVPGKPEPQTRFEVYEMIQDGTFQEILEGFSVNTRKLFWSQDQAITWIENNPELLHPQGWATFLPFSVKINEGTPKEVEDFFVAYAYRSRGGLKADVDRFSYVGVWVAEGRCRFVFPQR